MGDQSGASVSSSVPITTAAAPLPLPQFPTPVQPFPSAQLAGAAPPGFPFAQHSQPQIGQLLTFWQNQLQEIQNLGPDDLKNHQLPLARIKKIMKSDEDVRMISAEAPVLFSKACEMFILELTLRAWFQSEANKRRTLQRSDIAAAITSTDVFDFLVDIVPREGGLEGPDASRMPAAHPMAGMYPYFPAPAAYRPLGAPGGDAALQGAGFPVPLDPQTLNLTMYQHWWAQQSAQATQSAALQNAPMVSSTNNESADVEGQQQQQQQP